MLFSKYILDSHEFYYSGEKRFDIHPNNYLHSSIKSWLNREDNIGFYYTAFSVLEKKKIKRTFLDNRLSAYNNSKNKYAKEQSNFSDYVFLLSYNDIINPNYGFNKNDKIKDKKRIKKVTDYAKSQGVCIITANKMNESNGYYWLRSPFDYYSCSSSIVKYTGEADYDDIVVDASAGVCPAITIDLTQTLDI